MVNKKLSTQDEDDIYMEWLSGKSLSDIKQGYPVVVSTVQRVVKKKSRQDGTKKNCLISGVSKHIKNANEPLELAIGIFQANEEPIHEKQREFLLESLQKLSNNLDSLIRNIQTLSI
ncbi:hypothetical protein [Dasineura jujubifolia toursvirus 2a]|nr:hypothetical protein [Dasineura jujubifolia toursvirus 2a]